MEKKFKPFDKVLVRDRDILPKWSCDFYSHYDNDIKQHVTSTMGKLPDEDILPYEGNEHFVGTTDSPDEEVRLEDRELIIYFENIKYLENMDLLLARFDGISNDLIEVKVDCMRKWEYAVRFSDFNPNDMEATKGKILCVKNGKVIRYKN